MPLEIAGRKLYDLKELTELTGISIITWRKWIHTGKIDARKLGREWMIMESSLQDFLDGKVPE